MGSRTTPTRINTFYNDEKKDIRHLTSLLKPKSDKSTSHTSILRVATHLHPNIQNPNQEKFSNKKDRCRGKSSHVTVFHLVSISPIHHHYNHVPKNRSTNSYTDTRVDGYIN